MLKDIIAKMVQSIHNLSEILERLNFPKYFSYFPKTHHSHKCNIRYWKLVLVQFFPFLLYPFCHNEFWYSARDFQSCYGMMCRKHETSVIAYRVCHSKMLNLNDHIVTNIIFMWGYLNISLSKSCWQELHFHIFLRNISWLWHTLYVLKLGYSNHRCNFSWHEYLVFWYIE